jgi:thioredoxin reductase
MIILNLAVDVIIIGGGPSGLNAALVLGRARKTVVVIDEERPRNGVTHESHGFLTRDGMNPSEFRQVARNQIIAYPSVHFVHDTAITAGGSSGDFQVKTAQGTVYQCKRLLLAVGMKDTLLDIEGLTEVYGKSAFVCPYCDGWELRDLPLVLIAKGNRLFHMAKLLPGWTNQFTICSNGPDELTEEQRIELKKHNVPLFESLIQRIDSQEGIVQRIVLEDGIEVSCHGIFFAPKLVQGSDLAQTLGCQLTETGVVIVDSFGKTNVPGVYSAGDTANELHQLIIAAAAGAVAAIAINNELLLEDWERE